MNWTLNSIIKKPNLSDHYKHHCSNKSFNILHPLSLVWREILEPYYLKMSLKNFSFVDGRLLIAVDNTSLESILNVTNTLHKRAISNAIWQLKEFNIKLPASLWEYKVIESLHNLKLSGSCCES